LRIGLRENEREEIETMTPPPKSMRREAEILFPILVAQLLMLGGCVLPPTASKLESRTPATLTEQVDQTVTLTGTYRSQSKLGPYVYTSKGRIYIESSKGKRATQHPPTDLDGRLVLATGVLRFRESKQDVESSNNAAGPAAESPPDHFYLEAETVKIELAPRVTPSSSKPAGQTGG
jgi:hypothetical protein